MGQRKAVVGSTWRTGAPRLTPGECLAKQNGPRRARRRSLVQKSLRRPVGVVLAVLAVAVQIGRQERRQR